MTAIDESPRRSSEGWRARLRRARSLVVAAALVFAGLWAFGALAAVPAFAGFAAVAAAALIAAGGRPSAPPSALPSERAQAHAGGPLIEAVIEGIPDPVIALDPQGHVLALNARARTLAPALRRGEPVSLGLRVPDVLDAVRRASASNSPQRAEFFERVPVVRWYEAVVTPVVLAGSGQPSQLVLMALRDLTPLRRVEEMRADFIANASHELRTPLAALSGFIETLRGAARDDAGAREKFLGIMQEQANRMARLIDDLLSLSRIELNAHLRPDKEVDVVPIIRQVADGLQMLARDREVEVRIAAPEKVLVRADRDELLRVFENLIENALKYAASGKRLDISLTAAEAASGGREARIAVRDYGPGIAPEHLPRLTERFYRVDVTDSRAQGGTGLGLALVKHILNRHGGRLTIESTVGQGAAFTAHLPLGNLPPD